MKCMDCDKSLSGGIDTFGYVGEELCFECYAQRNAEAGEPHYGLGPHRHEITEDGKILTIMEDQSPSEEFMPDPDAPGLGIHMPSALPGWR